MTPAPLRGPHFGSYAPDDVGWLLTDLSGVALEAPTEEREETVQSGEGHYAESLPHEYLPDASYLALYRAALAATAPRLAHAVGTVTELVLRERGPDVVLASLARGGTPIGVLMRRWAAWAHGLDLPHYAVSIVRGRGIDRLALHHLAEHHDPSRVVFVDGWTGKGAITRELAAAVAEHEHDTGVRFDPDLAVLADPGRCTTTFGTREDWLIASACLNSTVSGLVSRTVLNPRLLGPHQYHGAKFYKHLARSDVSNGFVSAVTTKFAGVHDTTPPSDRVADGAGRRAVERITQAYDVGDVNLVKPGVGETTRVLLRRVPWRVLVRAGAPAADLAHIRLLAQRRGVPVEEVADLPYSCVGLIRPRHARRPVLRPTTGARTAAP
ncbi:cysteine protease StiP family protein [Pseudonocardia xinjiangensis]|uniref:cysteine protease StiP family protein n=1 Tax=Pseudonocardia xinjiangensis TaxID=75289 RepID=UPI003D8E5F1C